MASRSLRHDHDDDHSSGDHVVPAAEIPGLTGLLSLAVGVVVVAALYFGRDVLVPIMLAILLSFVLSPVVVLLERWRVPRALAVMTAMLVALGVIGALATVVGSQVATLAADVPRYAERVEGKIEALRRNVGSLPRTLDRLSAQLDRVGASALPPEPRSGRLGTEGRPMQVQVRDQPATPLGVLKNALAPLAKPAEVTIIVLVVAAFVLLQREDLRNRMIRLFGARDLYRTTTAIDETVTRLGRYFLTQLALNAGFGGAIGLGLWALGVPSPALWGVLAGLLRFVPYIGAPLAALPPLLLAAAVGADWTLALGVLALFLVLEPIMGYVIEPLVYGHSTGLSPTAVIVAAVFWTWLWGPVGLVLSTPLTLCLVVLGRHFEALEFLDVLFGDRPPLSPHEVFYQRLLAGDTDEALEQAETWMRDGSLSGYLDAVAAPGLRLAARDAVRGTLKPAAIKRIRAAGVTLLDDLATHHDAPPASVPPAGWRRDGAVLCVAARGVFDFAAATMAAQLLAGQGFGARVVPHGAVSRDKLPELDVPDARLVCVCGFDLDHAAPQLRFLVRRLRQRLPDVPMAAGIWHGMAPEADIGLDEAANSFTALVRFVRAAAVAPAPTAAQSAVA